ncbi:MAG: DUF3307 domain-containing protein [Rikenellaceae bacterium]
MELNILLRLLFAHIGADFIFQCDHMVKMKNKGISKSHKYLFIHSAIHALLSYVLVADWTNWLLPLIIFISHYVIDFAKTKVSRDKIIVFVLDQLLHVAVIVGLWQVMFVAECNFSREFTDILSSNHFWKMLIAYLLVLKPTSVLISLFFKYIGGAGVENRGLPKAGEWIGYIERMLIVTFVITSNIEAVGFLLAAKSVFRFGELKDVNDVKVTEYVLIGTLASFAVATIAGLLAL